MSRLYRIALTSVGTLTIPDWGVPCSHNETVISAFSALLCNGAKQFRAHLKWKVTNSIGVHTIPNSFLGRHEKLSAIVEHSLRRGSAAEKKLHKHAEHNYILNNK